MDNLLILARAIHFGSCLLLLSLFLVRLLIERPAAEEGGEKRALAVLCLIAAAGSGFLWFWVSVAGMSGSGLAASLDPQLFRMVLAETPPGQAWLARCGIGGLLGMVLCFPRGAWRWRAGLILAGAFAASLAWLGHAGAGQDGRRSIMLAADVAHLLASGAWPVGLLPFALLLRRRMRAGALAAAHDAARRFSAMSLAAVGVLAASGLINACFLVGSIHGMIATDYGRLLIVKITLFAVAATLGAWNLLVHKPRLETAPGALGAMARKVWVEAALGALIVLIVAILGTLPPGSSAGG